MSKEQPAGFNSASTAQLFRWLVHLGLILTLAGSLLTLITLSHSITVHVIVGAIFMLLLCCHLYQRRRTVGTLFKRLTGVMPRSSSSTRLAASDTILVLLVINVLLSGIIDGVSHQATQLPFLLSTGFPQGLAQWHKLAAIVLVLYATTHLVRRRSRLRRSRIT
jgi:hypothetical protein